MCRTLAAAPRRTDQLLQPAGALVASQSLSLPANGSAVVQPQAVLPGGFEGAAVITSDQYPAAVMRSVTTSGPVSTAMLYAGTQNPDQRLHFPFVHRPDADGSGPVTSFTAQNVSPSSPITLWVTVNDNGGQHGLLHQQRSPCRRTGLGRLRSSDLPGVPAGFSGTAEILWPWPNGWNEGFPLMAAARDLDGAHTSGRPMAAWPRTATAGR